MTTGPDGGTMWEKLAPDRHHQRRRHQPRARRVDRAHLGPHVLRAGRHPGQPRLSYLAGGSPSRVAWAGPRALSRRRTGTSRSSGPAARQASGGPGAPRGPPARWCCRRAPAGTRSPSTRSRSPSPPGRPRSASGSRHVRAGPARPEGSRSWPGCAARHGPGRSPSWPGRAARHGPIKPRCAAQTTA